MLSTIKLCKDFSERTVLSQVSFVLARHHRVGLVGPNGCGKSTLLKLLMGEVEPDGGRIERQRDMRLAYVRQNWDVPGELTVAEFVNDSEQADAHVMRTLRTAQFGSVVSSERTVATLSGGERTRLLLARALNSEADFLLLDEPTNNLDIDSIKWLEQALQRRSAGYLIASHDRRFLDNVTDQTFELDPETGRLTEYGGGYFTYVQKKQSDERRQWREYNEQQKRATKLEADVRAVKDQALANELTSVNDFVRGRAKKVAAKAKAREKRLMRMISDEHRIDKPRGQDRMRLDFKGRDLHNKLLFELRDVDLWQDETNILRSINLSVQGNVRIALSGRNGSGKSTLLAALVGALGVRSGTIYRNESVNIAYMRQDNLDIPDDVSVLDYFVSSFTPTSPAPRAMHGIAPTNPEEPTNPLPPNHRMLEIGSLINSRTSGYNGLHIKLMEPGAARTFLHRFLFRGDQVFANASSLSKGEQGKLQFACFMAAQPDLLILDEPTNHMDIPSIECLQEALQDYCGALIIVSHDREFLSEIGIDAVWRIVNSVVSVESSDEF